MAHIDGSDLFVVQRPSGADAGTYKVAFSDLEGSLDHPVHIQPGPTPPVANEGELWVDTSKCPPELLIYSECEGSGQWYPIEGGGGSGCLQGSLTIVSSNGNELGATLTAIGGHGVDAGSQLTASYVWSGAKSGTGETILADVEGDYTCTATITCTDGSELSTTAVWTVTDSYLPIENSSAPVIAVLNGTEADAFEGNSLVVSVDATVSGGESPALVETQWFKDEVKDSVGAFYLIGADDEGAVITAKQLFRDARGNELPSEASNGITIVARPADAITFVAKIDDDGTTLANTPGHFLTASADNIQGGTAPVEYAYQWYADGIPEALPGGGVKEKYILPTDVGATITCEVTVAEPDGSNPEVRTATYSKDIVIGASIDKPEVLTPPDGAGMGGDESYFPVTSDIIDVEVDGSIEDWTAVPVTEFTLNDKWYAVNYGNGKWVAISFGGSKRLMYATDPAGPWTAIETPENNSWQDVVYINGKWIAVAMNGSSNRIMYAEDPTETSNWTLVQVPVPENQKWRSIAYGNGYYVVISDTGTNRIMYATDPAGPWTLVEAPGDSRWWRVTYGDGYFVANAIDGTNRIMYATDPTDANNWTLVSVPENTNDWRSIAYGNGKWVAVASTGTSRIMYASNPAGPWTSVAAPEDNSWFSITYGNGEFVAVASQGTSRLIMYATDPTETSNWTLVEAPANNEWRKVSYGDGKFVAIAQSGNSNRIMYGGGLTTLTLTNENVYKSTDDSLITGETVEQVFDAGDAVTSSPVGPTGTVVDVTGNIMKLSGVTGTWAATQKVVSPTEFTKYAPDADLLEFTSTPPSGTDITTWGNATWEVDTDITFPSAMTATKALVEGQNQTLLPDERGTIDLEGETVYYVRVKYDSTDPSVESEWSDVNEFKTAEVLEDGWILAPAVPDTSWPAVTYGDGKYVAVGYDSSRAMYSTDGINWTESNAVPESRWTGLTYGNGIFVAVANIPNTGSHTGGPKLMYSSDGITWSTDFVTISTAPYWTEVAFGNGMFVVVAYNDSGSSRVAYSTNGLNWTPANTPTVQSWNGVCYGGGKWVIVGRDNSIIHSDDGINWSNAASVPTNNAYKAVTYGNGKFVAVGDLGATNGAVYSEDGSNWTGVNIPEGNAFRDVAYGAGVFVAVSNAGTNQIMYSEDAINWNPVAAPEPNGWYGVTYGSDKFVAVAISGENRVMYSFTGKGEPAAFHAYDETNGETISDVGIVKRFGVYPELDNRELGIYPLTEQPDYAVQAYTREGDEYQPIRDFTVELEEAQEDAAQANARLDEAESRLTELVSRIESLEAG